MPEGGDEPFLPLHSSMFMQITNETSTELYLLVYCEQRSNKRMAHGKRRSLWILLMINYPHANKIKRKQPQVHSFIDQVDLPSFIDENFVE